MTDQLALIDRPKLDPEQLIEEARERWRPVHTYCMFSAGNDSGTLAHRCRDHYDELFFMDTGTALPGVLTHALRFADWLDKPLVILSSGEEYERMVLEHGFPGPGMHGMSYRRLKERRVREATRIAKRGHPRSARVLYLSGVRRDESQQREAVDPFSERRGAKFVSPLLDWTRNEMRDYREDHQVPESDVAAIMHRSGECNCGAFANAAEERSFIERFWPEWWEENIGRLERLAEARGQRWCRWGGYDLDGIRTTARSRARAGIACTSCPTRQLELA